MALGRVILLLAVGAHVLAVSSDEQQSAVDLARLGEARPEDMLYDDRKSPQSAEVSSERNKEDHRNNGSSSQQLVPQVEIVYDSTGKGWVDKVKQVPDPATSPSREARRADNPRKDIIGTEIINDVAYLEIRHDKGQKSPPLVTVRRAEGSSTTTTASTTGGSDTTHTGKIHYSQIPFREVSTTSSPISEEVEDDSLGAQTEVSSTTSTEAPTEDSLSSEELDGESEAPAHEREQPNVPSDDDVTEAEEGEGEVHDYTDEAVSSEDRFDRNDTTAQSQPLSTTTSASSTTIENDYDDDDDGDADTEAEEDAALRDTTTSPGEPSSSEEPRRSVPSELIEDVTQTLSPPPETTTIRRIPISKITTPSVNFVMPTEPATMPEESPDSGADTFDSNEEYPEEEAKSSEAQSENNSTTKAPPEHAKQTSVDSGEVSGEVEGESPLTTLSPATDEPESETRAVDPTDVISVDNGNEANATDQHHEQTTESFPKNSNSTGADTQDAGILLNVSSETPEEVTSSGEVVDTKASTGENPETTTSKENLGREVDDDDNAFPTEMSAPTPDFFSQFVTVNPNMFYGIFKPSPTPQAVVKTSSEEPLLTSTASSTTTSTTTTTTNPPTTSSTTPKPYSTTTRSPTTTSTTTARSTTTTSPAPKPTAVSADPGFVLGLEGLFNFSPSTDSKPAEPARPSIARFGNSFETLKQTAGATEAPRAPSSTAIPSFFGDGAPLEMLHFPWSSDDNDFSGPGASLKTRQENANSVSTEASPALIPSTTPVATTTPQNRVNLFSKKIAPTLVPTRTPPTGPPKKFNLFASLTNANNPMGHKPDRRPELRPLKKVSGPWEPSIEPPAEENPEEFQDVDARPERKAFFGKSSFERRLVLEGLTPPSTTTRRPAPQFHPPTLLHDFAVPQPVDHRSYDMEDFLHRGTAATPRNAKSPISSKARTTLLMCAAIIGGAAIFFATLMVVCMRRTKNKRLIRRRAIDKFIQDSTSESSSNYGGSHSSYGRKGLLA